MSHSDPTQTAEGRISITAAPCDAEHVRAMRVAIRRMKNSLPLNGPSRYNSMVFTSLEKAAMWLGDIMGCLGELYPYPVDGRPALQISDDTTETYALNNEDWAGTAPEVKIRACRLILEQLTKQLQVWIVTPVLLPEGTKVEQAMFSFKYGAALQAAYNHLREARLDLGMELNAIAQERNK